MPPYLLSGLSCSALVTWLTYNIIFYVKNSNVKGRVSRRMIIASLLRVSGYRFEFNAPAGSFLQKYFLCAV